jgi:heterodisulfide reductase subunit C
MPGSALATVDPRATVDVLHEVMAATPIDTRVELCIQCGTCGGSCPSAADMDHTPRMIFAMLRAGLRAEVLRSNTPWMCVSCQFCTVRCPQEIRIPDVMSTLKALAEQAGTAPSTTAPAFSRTFVSNIHRFGRSYEVGLVALHYVRHYPLRLPAMAPVGVSMLASGRMGFGIHRIRQMPQLTAILDRAAALEAAR